MIAKIYKTIKKRATNLDRLSDPFTFGFGNKLNQRYSRQFWNETLTWATSAGTAVANTIANNLVNKYKDPMRRRVIRIPGIPHLQLKDLIYVINPNAENLIPNPSFEVNTDNWSVVTTGSIAAPLTRARDVPIPDGFFAGKLSITT